MSELSNLIYTEKYRPRSFEEIILEEKESVIAHLSHPEVLPSFIFYSSSPGTGKTSLAKLIISTLECDYLIINSSDERGIDTIREKISSFARALSTNGIKRCIFLDEAEGMTAIAQDSLKNLMETYSNNCFFIFSCNDYSKIIEPIRSRCISINFERPSKELILKRLEAICTEIELHDFIIDGSLLSLIDSFYPDIRSMILTLQRCKIENKSIIKLTEGLFEKFLQAIKNKSILYLYESVYSGELNIVAFHKWFFKYLFKNSGTLGFDKCSSIGKVLADIEIAWKINVNMEMIFISGILEVCKLL